MKTLLILKICFSVLLEFALFSNDTSYFIEVKQETPAVSLAEYNKQVANKNKLVLVYFSADWCAVCVKMKPIIAEVGKRDSLRVRILRINTDRDKEVANNFEIDALPVLMIYKNGCREWVNIGLIDEKELRYTLDYFLKDK